MANYGTLKAAIADVIKTNGNNAITGAVLQTALLSMVDSLGAGYQFMGVATPETNPGTPDQNVFYIAGTAGTYTNFGGIILGDNDAAILKYNGSWTKETTGLATSKKITDLQLLISEKFGDSGLVYLNNLVTKYSGKFISDTGAIITVGDQLYFYSAPIHLLPGQSLIYKGYTAFGSYPFFESQQDGTIIGPCKEIRNKLENYGDYSRDNVNIYTATTECYIIVNGYATEYYICSAYIGTLYDITGRIKDIEKETDGLDVLLKFNLTPHRYLNNSGQISEAGDVNYNADENYYKLNQYGINLAGVYMANQFPVVAFYDENKSFISAINTPSGAITRHILPSEYPSGAVYFRVACYDLTNYEQGFYIGEPPQENIIKQTIEQIENELSLVDYSKETNLFVNGHYINYSDGSAAAHADYACTDYLPIPIKKDIGLIYTQTGNMYMAYIAFYDANKTFISALSNSTPGQQETAYYTVQVADIPDGAAYIRASAGLQDSGRQSGIDYSASVKEIVESLVPDVEDLELRVATLEAHEEAAKPIKFDSFAGSNTLSPGGVLSLLGNKIKVNSILSAIITGTIQNIEIGVGYEDSPDYDYRTYGAFWLEITATQVKVYAYYNADPVLINTYNHGLTLTQKTFIGIVTPEPTTAGEADTLLRIVTDTGDVWEQNVGWGQGRAFVKNNNTSGNLGVKLRFFPRDITNNVWVFGDSYFGYWPQYLYGLGLVNWLRNSQPGSSPDAAYTELQNLLSLGYRPGYVFWCLGMNGTTTEEKVDGQYVIAPYQKTYIDNVKALCDLYDIVPVFMAIPTVPTRQKTGFRTYIQSLGVRYVDAYAAVGADEYGIWHGKPTLRAWKNGSNLIYTQIMGDGHSFVAVNDNTFTVDGTFTGYQVTAVGDSNSSITVNGTVYNRSADDDIVGLLSTDGIHPTADGGKVLAYSVIAEFPEIGVCE